LIRDGTFLPCRRREIDDRRHGMRALRQILLACLIVITGAPAGHARPLGEMSRTEITALQQRLKEISCYRGPIDGLASATLQTAIEACPSQDPVLRIETGMHVARITGIDTDRACRIAVTGSDDKTLRIWSLADGHLLRTLRVPIGPGDRGKIYGVAVSPYGRWIAAGGYDPADEGAVYIFDGSTGAQAARIGVFTDNVNHLVFSPDGRWLAATSNKDQGLAVIDAQNWQVAMKDSAYEAESHGAAFGPDERLYTVSSDGKLRRYAPGSSFKKELEVATKSGGDAMSVAVDPSGQLVAVAFETSMNVEIYDAATLRFRFAADTKVPKAKYDPDLRALAWSSDGAFLFAGGGYGASSPNGWKYPVLTFNREGRRVGSPLFLGNDSVASMHACRDAIAVAVMDPALGMFDRNHRVTLWKETVAPDIRRRFGFPGDSIAVALDAKRVRFGLRFGGAEPVLFDLVEGTVTSAPNPALGMIAPTTEGLPIAKWEEDYHPTFAGSPIKLQQFEKSRALAVRRDRSGFVLATDFMLRTFDARGQQLWEQEVPGATFGVNLSGDGSIIVAAYRDGTMRWHRWSDGNELLALFVNRETKAWVAWTPSGYYMASPGGEDLIGWHVNRNWGQVPDFFPASRFRERFNRPDIVRLVLDTRDEDAAVRQANATAKRPVETQPLIAHLPPVVRITGPDDGTHVATDTVTLAYAVRSPSGDPVERVEVLIDGRPLKAVGLPIRRVASDVEIKGSVSVTLTRRVTEVGLIAWSGALSSQAARVKLTWDRAPEATRKLYALVVGVSSYAERDMALHYAAKDARDFAKALQDQKGGYYGDVATRVLADREATREGIVDGLKWLQRMASQPNDVAVLFLAGHGLTDEKQTYWFLPADSSEDSVRSKGVSQDEMRRSLQNIPGKVLWFLDTCHAGRAARRTRVDINVLVNAVTASENGGIVVYASSTGRQVSIERDDWGNGAFTKAIVEGIALGKADLLGKGLITTSSLDTFVASRVQELTERKQNPVMGRSPEEPDFTIAQVRKR
jgi:Caspase domain/WD domain, G-beta repeat